MTLSTPLLKSNSTPSCTLCLANSPVVLYKNRYTYFHCLDCGLVFANPDERLSPHEEKKRYDQHQNSPGDSGYRNFLNQLFSPLSEVIPPNSFGLDYGSGPGPTLSVMFEEAGYRMNIYDPFYAQDSDVLQKQYDFITTTETVEHFYSPAEEFKKLWDLLKPGGFLGIMTLMLPNPEEFSSWHYIKDDTHVAFYSQKTFRWLADLWSAKLTFHGNRVIILQKVSK